MLYLRMHKHSFNFYFPGNNPLMCVLYDVNQDADKHVDVENIQEENSMWSIHTRITVEHLTQEFLKTCQQSKKLSGTKTRGSQDREILQLFLKEVYHMIGYYNHIGVLFTVIKQIL